MKFSIIIPTYNRQELISMTVQSIINQQYSNWEAIIIDDDSTDNTRHEIQKIAEQNDKIKLYKRDRMPKGAATCRNIGIEKSMGNYIIFLDSDDLLKPFALKQRCETLKENLDLDYCVFQTVNFSQHPDNEQEIWNTLNNEDNLTRFFKLDSVWHTSGAVWKTEILKQHIKFDENLLCWQDVDFHIQALQKNFTYKVFFNLPADVLYRRHTESSISQGGFNKLKRTSQFYFLKKYLNKEINTEQRKILSQLYVKILQKNADSKFIINTIRMNIWKLLNKKRLST